MTSFWSQWIIWLTVISFVGICWILFSNRKVKARNPDTQQTTGHNYDGIEELDNPLPAWWFNLFVLTIVFGVVYLLLMPGMGNFPGLLGWTSTGQWEQEVAEADARYAQQFEQFLALTPAELAGDDKAMKMAGRIFANNCAVCHGNAGRGNFGFPNLQDSDWLYGGAPEQIRQTIAKGRSAVMPAWGSILDDSQLRAVTEHLLNLGSGTESNAPGRQVYATYCAACHGADGGGNILMGAPTLNDDIWLYGGNRGQIMHSIQLGRNGVMPAHEDQLGEAKIHLLTAYVLSLSAATSAE